MRALWAGEAVAESDNTVVVEGNHYFPPDAVQFDYLQESDTTSRCPWKGEAHYYHVVVNGVRCEDGAWYYPQPKPEAASIKGYLAFWHGVEVVE